MAFALGAANAPSLGDWLSPGHTPRADHGSLPILNARNTSTTPANTVNLFIDALASDLEFGASIIRACVDQTVYAIQCTDGPAYVDSKTCGPNGAVATLTVGASKYEFSSAITSSTLGYDVTVTAQETCVLAGTTAATCSPTLKGTAAGTSTSTSSVTTLSGTGYYRFNVEITGGAEKTAKPTACGGTNAAVGLNPKTMATWAFAIVIGVASILTA